MKNMVAIVALRAPEDDVAPAREPLGKEAQEAADDDIGAHEAAVFGFSADGRRAPAVEQLVREQALPGVENRLPSYE